jgi:selenocysteine-specific elongation factor
VIARSRLNESVANLALKELLDDGRIVGLEDVLIAAAQWASLNETVIKTLDIYHQTYPLRHGMPREELKSRLKLPPRLFNLVLHRMAMENILTEAARWVALPGHAVKFSPFQQVKVDQLMAQFAESPYAPPTVKECQALTGEDIYSALVDFGDLVPVSDEVVFRRLDYQTMEDKILLTLRQKGQITLAEVRDLFQTSRRYAQALLEHLDAIGVTIRDGDFRRQKK